MRMTNKIMQNNSLHNINNNKILQDKLNTQMSTGKKLTRPSDDPVVAIRALRLRSDVSQIVQFYEKNAPDGEAWMKVTGDALNTTTDVINGMIEQATRGANKDMGYEDLDIIVTQLRELKEEFYATGNVDFAGRYVFTGFRTDTPLTYTEEAVQDFQITEKLTPEAIDTINYTTIGNLDGLSDVNYDPTAGIGEDQNNIKNADIYRIRLSYDQIKDTVPTVQQVTDPTTIPPTTADLIPAGNITVVSSTADPNPYELIQQQPGNAILIPETGELLVGTDLYENTLKNLPVDTQMRITYEKDDWKVGDMRPQHYFECTDKTDPAKVINYNFAKDNTVDPPLEYISMDGVKQIIEYDVGYNQKVRINTTADEVFTLNMDRNIDDMEKAMSELQTIDFTRNELSTMLKNMKEGDPGYDNLKATYEAADKAYTYVRENVQKMFEGLISKVQSNLDTTSVAITDNGTRASRLDLITNRLMTQKTTFETLQSTNEDIDITEATIKLTSASYTYQSALMATGKILQNSLMNYI